MLKLAPLKKESEDTIFVAKHEEGSKKLAVLLFQYHNFLEFFREDIQKFFEVAMANNEEGIVVKRADSVYLKGQRLVPKYFYSKREYAFLNITLSRFPNVFNRYSFFSRQNELFFRSAANGWFKLKPSASKDCDLDLALVAILPRAGRDGRTLYRFAAYDESKDHQNSEKKFKKNFFSISSGITTFLTNFHHFQLRKTTKSVCPCRTASPTSSAKLSVRNVVNSSRKLLKNSNSTRKHLGTLRNPTAVMSILIGGRYNTHSKKLQFIGLFRLSKSRQTE